MQTNRKIPKETAEAVVSGGINIKTIKHKGITE